MTVTVDTVITTFNIQFRHFQVQTKAQRTAGTNNTPAYVLYDSFNSYWNLANIRIANDLAARGGMTLSETEGIMCVCCLIADLLEKSNPDWAYTSQSVDAEGVPKVSISRNGQKTAYMMMYEDLLLSAYKKYAAQGMFPYNGTATLDSEFTHTFGENLYVADTTTSLINDW